ANLTILGVPQNTLLQQVCPDFTRVDWDPVPNATGYVIFVLGEKYMDSVGTTTNLQTFFDIPIDATQDEWIAVSAISPDGTIGQRSIAIERPSGLQNCVVTLDVTSDSLLSPRFNYLPGCDASEIPVSLIVRNEGLAPVFDLPVFYSVNNGPVSSDTINGLFPAGDQQAKTFSNLIDVNTPGVYELKVWTAQVGDQNVGNDTIIKRIEVPSSTTVGLPFKEDFESFSTCSTLPNCESTVCSLSNGFINLDNTFADEIDWRINQASTSTGQTGPTFDHKPGTNDGKYAYLESSGGCQGNTAILWTPCIDLTGATQPELSFWLHQFGVTSGRLSVDIYSNGAWTNSAIIVNGNQGDLWRERTISLLPYVGQTIIIQFRGTIGNGFRSDIAIDDIQVYDRMGPPLVDFSADRRVACLNSHINFTDLTDNAPNSWEWSFEPDFAVFSNGSSNTDQNPVVSFPYYGTYEVSLKTANANGTDSLVRTSYIEVVEGATPNWQEDFESGVFPPAQWTIDNPDGLIGWDFQTVTGVDNLPTTAAFMDNRDYTASGQIDFLTSFVVDLSTATSPRLSFDYAHVSRGINRADNLRVEISTDCGETFTQAIFNASGAALATALDDFDQWFPTSAADWDSTEIDLSLFVGNQVSI
ncbi:MAG: PKD domain-containing protein, partial [Bacteroidota bacterium]